MGSPSHTVLSTVQCYPRFFSTSSRAVNVLWWTVATMYNLHWVGFIAILFLRLQTVFSNSTLDLYHSTLFNVTSIAVICTATAGFLLYATMYLTGVWSATIISFVGASNVLMLLLYSQVLAFVFVRRLFRLHALSSRDDALIAAMTKISLIALVSIIGSVV